MRKLFVMQRMAWLFNVVIPSGARNPYPLKIAGVGIPRRFAPLNDKSRAFFLLILILVSASLACSHSHADLQTVTLIIEASPLNLDPRIGIDAYSERID